MIRVLLILIEMRYKCKTSAGGGREREGCVARESSVLWGFVGFFKVFEFLKS